MNDVLLVMHSCWKHLCPHFSTKYHVTFPETISRSHLCMQLGESPPIQSRPLSCSRPGSSQTDEYCSFVTAIRLRWLRRRRARCLHDDCDDGMSPHQSGYYDNMSTENMMRFSSDDDDDDDNSCCTIILPEAGGRRMDHIKGRPESHTHTHTHTHTHRQTDTHV